jgi:hypothetical protein
MRFFNTAGPVICDEHYCLPPLERLDLDDIIRLIDQEKYFVVYAPHQSGKTTYLLSLMDYLNSGSKYYCLYVSLNIVWTTQGDVDKGIEAIIQELASSASVYLRDSFPTNHGSTILTKSGPLIALNELLTRWTKELDRPLVLLLDEMDSLIGDTLISVLRQLRSGFTQRPSAFPQSVILCGVRDVRDYGIYDSDGQKIETARSIFNIKVASLLLNDFTRGEVERLYGQHTEETGQQFEPDAIDLLWQLSQGQPWLVNALGYELCFRMMGGKERSQAVTADMVVRAKENLILCRDTHLDELAGRLKEKRVRRVIGPMLEGVELIWDVQPDDIQYVMDLGLLKREARGLEIANPIYQEIIPRAFNNG